MLITLTAATLVTVEPPATTGTADVLVVQGNEFEDFDGSRREESQAISQRHLALTQEALADSPSPDLVIWPENSIDRDPFAAEGADLAGIVEAGGALTGGRLLAGMNLTGPDPITFRNTSVLVDEAGAEVDAYQKRRYVPFGEYVPWRHVLGDFPPLRQIPRDGLPGPGPQQVHVNDLRLAVVICFESLFADLARSNILGGDELAQLLIVSTSDSTFGRSWEPEQHLAQSRLRAVETGRHTIHAAISGTSAFIGQDGSVTQQTELWEAVTIRAELPLADGRTPFLVTGDLISPVAAIALLLLLAYGVRAGLTARARGR